MKKRGILTLMTFLSSHHLIKMFCFSPNLTTFCSFPLLRDDAKTSSKTEGKSYLFLHFSQRTKEVEGKENL